MRKFLKILSSIIGIAITVAVLYFAAVYIFVFNPSFTRHAPSEDDNRRYFGTEERFNNYLSEKAWFEQHDPQKITIDVLENPNRDDSNLNAKKIRLVAYNFPAETEVVKGTMILMHGYHSEPIREYATLIHFYHDQGYNIILPYQRTHGASEGNYITFGVNERYDLREWIYKTNEIYGENTPLFIQGISMGCATSVMVIGLDLPENVRGVIADCGFTTPEEIIWKVLTEDKKLPTANLIMKIGEYLTDSIANFSMSEYSTYEAIDFNKKRFNQIPVLFFHGTKDDFVPIKMSDSNFARCLGSFAEVGSGDDKSLLFTQNDQAEKYKYVQIQDSPHAIANLINPEKYHSEVLKFLDRYGKLEVTK